MENVSSLDEQPVVMRFADAVHLVSSSGTDMVVNNLPFAIWRGVSAHRKRSGGRDRGVGALRSVRFMGHRFDRIRTRRNATVEFAEVEGSVLSDEVQPAVGLGLDFALVSTAEEAGPTMPLGVHEDHFWNCRGLA